jgi:hypothetical protein
MKFKKNKSYFKELMKENDKCWVSKYPMFLSGNKGLYPVFYASGRTGVINKNPNEFILKELKESKDDFEGLL